MVGLKICAGARRVNITRIRYSVLAACLNMS